MDFDFTEEQRLLRDSVDRLLADRYTFDKRRAYLAEPEGWSRAQPFVTRAAPKWGAWRNCSLIRRTLRA